MMGKTKVQTMRVASMIAAMIAVWQDISAGQDASWV